MTATYVKTDSAAKLLKRIRDLKNSVEYLDKKFNRTKIELWQNVYLYYETKITKEQYTIPEVSVELVELVGALTGYWTRARRVGQFIRENRLDCETVRCSSLSHVGARTIDGKHLPRITKALEAGVGPTGMHQLLCELGYEALKGIPDWTKKMVRRNKSSAEDWTLEMGQLLKGIKKTEGCEKATLTLHVGRKEWIVK